MSARLQMCTAAHSFVCILGIPTQVLMFAWQALYPLRLLLSSVLNLSEVTKRFDFTSREVNRILIYVAILKAMLQRQQPIIAD